MYKLNREWTLFFHAKDKVKNYDSNTYKIMDIDSLEKFWGTYNYTPEPKDIFYDGYNKKYLKMNGTRLDPNAFSFFEKGVKPTWDDEKNINGAEWSIRKFNGLKDISDMWKTSLVDLISDSFEYSEHIKGIRIVDSTLPEKPMYRLEFWFDNVEYSENINNYIVNLFKLKNNLLYRVHKDVKES